MREAIERASRAGPRALRGVRAPSSAAAGLAGAVDASAPAVASARGGLAGPRSRAHWEDPMSASRRPSVSPGLAAAASAAAPSAPRAVARRLDGVASSVPLPAAAGLPSITLLRWASDAAASRRAVADAPAGAAAASSAPSAPSAPSAAAGARPDRPYKEIIRERVVFVPAAASASSADGSGSSRPAPARAGVRIKDPGADADSLPVTAADCDRAVDHLTRLQAAYDRRKYTERRTGLQKALRNAPRLARDAGRWVVALPARTAALARRPWRGEDGWRAALGRGWIAAKEALEHVWVGSRLLVSDVSAASRLGLRVLRGKRLTRRERRQLRRTTADVFRLVPMSIFVLVPFMEFLLPLALKASEERERERERKREREKENERERERERER